MKKITDNNIRWAMNNRYWQLDRNAKAKFIDMLICENKFELIKEYFKADVVKEMFTNRCNAGIQNNIQQIERAKEQMKKLRQEIKQHKTIINKLNQNL